jgi:hypothetical protein
MLILHLARHVVVDNEREKVVPDPFSLSLSGNQVNPGGHTRRIPRRNI